MHNGGKRTCEPSQLPVAKTQSQQRAHPLNDDDDDENDDDGENYDDDENDDHGDF